MIDYNICHQGHVRVIVAIYELKQELLLQVAEQVLADSAAARSGALDRHQTAQPPRT